MLRSLLPALMALAAASSLASAQSPTRGRADSAKIEFYDSEPTTVVQRDALRGSAKAQRELAERYRDGKGGLVQSDADAIYWFRKSAEQGHVFSQYLLGALLTKERATGTWPFLREGSLWLRRAAESPDANANFPAVLALVSLDQLVRSAGPRYDRTDDVKWFLARAGQGDAKAMHSVGGFYQEGIGLPKDINAALKWYEKSALAGYAFGYHAMGRIYDEGILVPQSSRDAAKWYLKGAESGDGSSQGRIASMYFDGRGVAQNDAEAARWYRLAAEGFADLAAAFNLGLMYQQGRGVPQDFREAIVWYRKAAQVGNASAELNLGVMYAKGQGVPQDHAQAVTLFRKAADKGNSKAQWNLGLCYLDGTGVPKSDMEAYFWLNLAAAGADSSDQANYAKTRDMVMRRLSPQQRTTIQARATAWAAEQTKR